MQIQLQTVAETKGFGIGRVVTESPSEEETSAPETTSGEQYSPQAIVDIPESVETFVNYYALYSGEDYDSRHAVEKDYNILRRVVHNFPCVQIDSRNNIYPGNGYDFTKQSMEIAATCPWDTNGLGAWSFDPDTVDWVCKNIFNISDEALEQFYEEAYDDHQIWKNDGNYCIVGGGKGSPMEVTEVERYQFDGRFYHVVYNVYEYPINSSEKHGDLLKTYYTVLELKNIDGKEYWSMHYHTTAIPYDIEIFDING